MLQLGSAFQAYAIDASDGKIGTIADFLFDDRTWRVRWLVVDTGKWLTGRKVLLHSGVVGQINHEQQELPVALTKAQVEGSPELSEHEPVSKKMERRLFDYYYPRGPASDESDSVSNPISPQYLEPSDSNSKPADPDDHLRSVAAVTGYDVRASDGALGKVVDLLIDDASWGVGAIVVETGNWWSGKQMSISPEAVGEISWLERRIRLAVSFEEIKSSPPFDEGDQA